MKKSKRGTPEKLVCEYCGKEKAEITFTIGACSRPGTDWCMIYGTGKMACPECYAKGTAEAEAKINGIIKPVPAPAESPVEQAQKDFFNNKPGSGAALDKAIAAEESAPAFETKDAEEALRPIIDRLKKSVYLPEYRDKVTDAEAIGVLISKYFHWDGSEVLTAAYSGLEDSNYHSEAAVVDRMIKGENTGELIKKMAAELRAIHSEHCKDCSGGCPTLELIAKAEKH